MLKTDVFGDALDHGVDIPEDQCIHNNRRSSTYLLCELVWPGPVCQNSERKVEKIGVLGLF